MLLLAKQVAQVYVVLPAVGRDEAGVHGGEHVPGPFRPNKARLQLSGLFYNRYDKETRYLLISFPDVFEVEYGTTTLVTPEATPSTTDPPGLLCRRN